MCSYGNSVMCTPHAGKRLKNIVENDIFNINEYNFPSTFFTIDFFDVIHHATFIIVVGSTRTTKLIFNDNINIIYFSFYIHLEYV